MEKEPLWTKNFLTVCASNFFLFLVFYLMFVTMPLYAMDGLHVGEGEAGLVITIFLIAAILIRPLTGHWVETIGRRRIALTALSIFGVSAVLYLLTDAFTAVLAIRFLQGIGFGMGTTVLGAMAADVIPVQRKGEGMGYFAMSMNIAMVIGPFLGLFLVKNTGFRFMFLTCLVFAFAALVTALFITISEERSGSMQRSFVPKVSGLFEVTVIPIALTGAVMALAYSGVLSFVSVYAKGLGLETYATFFFVVYAVVLLLSRPFTGKWFDQHGENVIVIPAIAVFGIGMILLSIADSGLLLLISGGLIGLGWGTIVPSFQTIALKKVPERPGAATATFFAIFDTGMGVGSYVVGAVASGIGFSSLYFNSSFLVFAGIIIYMVLHGRRKQKASPRIEYSS
ncbi:MFS transporter [Halobacillus sp. ACCC02827]|uniref:MFS transporter n=1 Tax=Halobacillus sp. ACCC02827 TaxID=3052090 RepID=UPI0025703366|nr:MFS transporter [Halobacillus sp. ACCC02827]WJE15503.1 MFS transporter [Halobacillus sp. ACCC02827]